MTHSGGFARGVFDGYRPFTPDVSFPIASTSKIVTAVAAYKILRDHGLPPETTKIGAYLPSTWLLGPGSRTSPSPSS